MKISKKKSWKKAVGFLSAAAILTISIISCGGNQHKDEDVESFRVFVTDLQTKGESEIKENWIEIEKEYEEKVAQIDKKEDQLEENLKEDYAQLQKDYEALKEKLNAEMEEETVTLNVSMSSLYETILTNEGDMDLSAVNTDNIENIYIDFVKIVDLHKNDYTREDWDEVDVLWDALNKRKNEVEDNLSSEQKLAIGEEKVKYGACKATNKLPAKSKEKRSVDK